ncbi:MAG: hypothetical protein AVDCRST_MAG07-794 [uncultured Frankineae bacterium]|uniref:Uncharacterized protein n=1 Tax=uncultured Frankineae bacterium TaxID=437475 RepID=A0A6J4KTZ9_9ACTN|nr:MAG: hypothetical protein AVDCRST_MAG07-794 [uncultured Frankineae bacterium]
MTTAAARRTDRSVKSELRDTAADGDGRQVLRFVVGAVTMASRPIPDRLDDVAFLRTAADVAPWSMGPRRLSGRPDAPVDGVRRRGGPLLGRAVARGWQKPSVTGTALCGWTAELARASVTPHPTPTGGDHGARQQLGLTGCTAGALGGELLWRLAPEPASSTLPAPAG